MSNRKTLVQEIFRFGRTFVLHPPAVHHGPHVVLELYIENLIDRYDYHDAPDEVKLSLSVEDLKELQARIGELISKMESMS